MSSVQSLVRQIVTDACRQRLRAGDRLPSLSAMGKKYSVGRSPLREALAVLGAAGLVRLRRGNGMGNTIGDLTPHQLASTILPFLCLSGATCEQIFDAWVFAAPLLADAAASNLDKRAINGALATRITGDSKEAGPTLAEAVGTLEFFSLLARGSENPVLVLLLESLAETAAAACQEWLDPESPAFNVRIHQSAILSAVLVGDRAAARETTEAYLRALANEVHPGALNRVPLDALMAGARRPEALRHLGGGLQF